MKTIVSDATSLIVLAKIERLDILRAFFESILIPSQVMEEIQAKADHDSTLWQQPCFECVNAQDLPLYKDFCTVLDPGESEAMALAEFRCLPLLIDEKKGRSIAGRRSIPVIGLLGLLLRGAQRGFWTANEAGLVLAKAHTVGFRLSPKLAQEFAEACKSLEKQ